MEYPVPVETKVNHAVIGWNSVSIKWVELSERVVQVFYNLADCGSACSNNYREH